MLSILLSLLLLTVTALGSAIPKQPVAEYHALPSLRDQDALERSWVSQRFAYIPEILRKHGYDAWIVTQREYAEDTVFRSLVSSTTTMSARRRTLYLFHVDSNEPVLHLIDNTQAMWDVVNQTLFQLDPKKIAINVDEDMAFSDGLHTGEGRLMRSKLDPKYRDRLSSNRAIGVETIAYRAGGQEQLEMYRLMMENVWAMIHEGFSDKVIEVGKTTANDLEWWFRDVMRWRIGCTTWFPPTVTIYRPPQSPPTSEQPAMLPGDMLHVDIGITAMNMNTDTQHLGYILRSNETEPPAGLLAGLRNANKMQDMVRKEMIPGRTGNDVLKAVLRVMDDEALRGLIYSHPIGDYGHSAGALIGMTNIQTSVPGGGDNVVLEDYWTSVELGGVSFVSEWGVDQRFELEEDVYWNNESRTFEWVYGRQTEFHLVHGKSKSRLAALLRYLGRATGRHLLP